jgi:hypothetical protein
VTLTGDLTAIPADHEVRFEYVVHNEGDEPVELTFTSGQTADVVVHEETAPSDGEPKRESDEQSGEPLWRWSDGRMFTQAIETGTVAADESLTVDLSWEDPAPGSYTAEATLAATELTAPASVAFEVD